MAIHTKGLGQNPYTQDGNLKGISDRAIKRLMALDKALFEKYGYFPVIGPKPLKKLFEHDGNWFNHNRGSNDFEGKEVLGFVGLPVRTQGRPRSHLANRQGHDRGTA